MRFTPLLLLLASCAQNDFPVELRARLEDPREDVRHDALWELQDLRNPAAASRLAAALADRSPKIRTSAAMLLEDWETLDRVSVAALARASRDPDASVRLWSVHALKAAGDPETLPALHQAKLDRDPSVQEAAIRAIAEMDARLQARDVRYHPPVILPDDLLPPQQAVYRKAHHDEWTFTITLVDGAAMTGGKLSIGTGTICEAPPIVTRGAYAGQADASAFLHALHRRCRREPAALSEFRALRERCLKLHPRRAENEEK